MQDQQSSRFSDESLAAQLDPRTESPADALESPTGDAAHADELPPLDAYADEAATFFIDRHGKRHELDPLPGSIPPNPQRVPTDYSGLPHRSILIETAHGDWPDPIDPFQARSIPSFNPDWVPPVLANFVLDQASVTGFDPGMLAMQCIITAAGVVSDEIQVRVRPNQRWTESARLWGVVIGSPSCGKSPGLNIAMSQVKKINSRVIEAAKHRKADYDLQLKVYEAQEKAYIQALAKGEPAKKPVRPDRPAENQVYVDDITKDAISEALRGSMRGLLLRKDELAGWIEGFDGYTAQRGNERQTWLELYNGGEPPINRIGRGNMVIENWSACIIGGIQPDALMRLAGRLNMAEDGLLQRFIPYWSQDRADEIDKAENYECVRKWADVLEKLYELRPSLEYCYFHPDAQAIRREANDWIASINRRVELPPAMPEFMAKWGSMLPRLALTFHCIEAAAAQLEAVPPEISFDTMARAWRFMHECTYHHALEMYALVSNSSGSKNPIANVCSAILAREMSGFDLTTLSKYCHSYKNAPRPAKQEILVALIEAGWIRGIGNPDKTTKTVTRFAVNPRVFEGKFEARLQYEKTRRADQAGRFDPRPDSAAQD